MSKQAMLKIASLGMSCQSAHQIGRMSIDDRSPRTPAWTFQKGPFDWLICPPQSTAAWLNAGMPLFEDEEITVLNNHAWWARYSFWFWHGFYLKDENSNRQLNIPATLNREREKLAYQRDQFCRLDPATTLFVVSNTQNNLLGEVFDKREKHRFEFDAVKIDALQQALNKFFCAQCLLRVISRADRCFLDEPDRFDLHLVANDTSQWKGDDREWDRIMSDCQTAEFPLSR